MSTSTVRAHTYQGARELDRAAAVEAAARAGQEQARTKEAAALAELRVAEARAEADQRAQARTLARRAELDRTAAFKRQEQADQRAAKRAGRVAVWRERRPLLAVVPMMATSAAVALPAQYDYYRAATGDSPWAAAVIAGMVEGGTWLGATLENAAIERDRPAGFYRALTWTLAATAAVVNFGHGLSMRHGGWQVAVVFALASLMGVTSWSAYARLRTQQHSDTTAEQLRLAAWRRVRYPRLSWRAASLRAAVGASLSAEAAWVRIWQDHTGTRPVETDRREPNPRQPRPRSATRPARSRVRAERAADRSQESLLAELDAAIAAGDFEDRALTPEAVRVRLGIRWERAKALLDQREVRLYESESR